MYEPGPSILPAFWICLYLTQSHLHAQCKAEIAPGAILQCSRNVPSFHFHYVPFPRASIEKHLISLPARASCRGDGAAAVLCSLLEDVLFCCSFYSHFGQFLHWSNVLGTETTSLHGSGVGKHQPDGMPAGWLRLRPKGWVPPGHPVLLRDTHKKEFPFCTACWVML